MKRHHLWATLLLVVALSLSTPALLAAGDNGAKASNGEKVAVVNSHCPVMGTEIDAKNVSADLVREFGESKVGFCCAGCLGKWDQMSDSEKSEKLEKSLKK